MIIKIGGKIFSNNTIAKFCIKEFLKILEKLVEKFAFSQKKVQCKEFIFQNYGL